MTLEGYTSLFLSQMTLVPGKIDSKWVTYQNPHPVFFLQGKNPKSDRFITVDSVTKLFSK